MASEAVFITPPLTDHGTETMTTHYPAFDEISTRYAPPEFSELSAYWEAFSAKAEEAKIWHEEARVWLVDGKGFAAEAVRNTFSSKCRTHGRLMVKLSKAVDDWQMARPGYELECAQTTRAAALYRVILDAAGAYAQTCSIITDAPREITRA